jgi:hypothetical protein
MIHRKQAGDRVDAERQVLLADEQQRRNAACGSRHQGAVDTPFIDDNAITRSFHAANS